MRCGMLRTCTQSIASHRIASHRIASHHITSHHITSHHITSHHITSHHIASHRITSHHITNHLSITSSLTSCLLANRCRAVIDRYGVLSLDEAPPIDIAMHALRPSHSQSIHQSPLLQLTVRDAGTGLSARSTAASNTVTATATAHASTYHSQPFDWFHTSAPETVADRSGYTYSRRFGSSLTGLGVGLAVSRQYVRTMGGTLQVLPASASLAAGSGEQPTGALAVATFDRDGTAPLEGL